MSLNNLRNDGWIMDTGATDHVHTHSGILNSFSNNHYPSSIYVDNGPVIPVMTSGHSIFLISNIYRPLHLKMSL